MQSSFMEGGAGRQGVLAGMTLGDVLGKDKDVPLRVNHRTLLDIIRQEEPNCRAYENLIDHHENKKGWKFFKDRRLRPRCSLDSHVWAAGVPVPPFNVGFHRDLVSTSNHMVMGAGSESNQRPPLAQLLRDQSVRVVEQVLEKDDSGEMTWAGRGQVQWLNQNQSGQVQEDDDPGEVPWAGRGQVQSLNQNRSEQVQEDDDSGEVTWAGSGQAQSLNQNRSKKVQEGDDSGEVPWAGRGQVQSLNQNRSVHVFEQVQEDDDSGEVPWVGRGQVQSLNHYLSPLGSSRQNDVDHGDSLHIEHVLVSAVPAPIGNSMSSMLTHNLPRIPSPGQPDEPVRSVRLSEALAAEREHMQVAVSSTEATRIAQYEEEVTETNNHNEERDDIGAEAANEQQQVRMSLMDLLEETDSRRIGWSSYSGVIENSLDIGNEYVEEEGSNFVEQNCCVCMVRHKGSAFIPCGHTFCRLCSRELWVNRGNCPICNGFILEILDIF